MRRPAVLLIAAGLAAVPAAQGSIFVADNATRPRLAVDARGNAQVTWLQNGAPQSVIVPPKGQLSHGGSLAGPDVSRPAPGIPLALVVRRVGATTYALQQWQVQPNGPLELHLSRWTGAPPTRLRLAFAAGRLTGAATYQGRPLTGFSKTLEGKRLRIYVFLDSFGPKGWTRLVGVAPKADGTFAVLLRPGWTGTRYRATVAGPGYAPDAQAVAAG